MRCHRSAVMWFAICACAALMGCSDESLAPAVMESAFGAERQATGSQQPMAEPAQDVAAPDQAARAPSAAPKTAEAVIEAVFEGLEQNRPDVVWDALPASYQRDLNDLLHLFASRLHPEAWRWFLQISEKGATLLRALGKRTVDSLDVGADKKEDAIRRGQACESLAVALERLSKTGSAGLERLRTIDFGELLRTEGRLLMSNLAQLRDDKASLVSFLEEIGQNLVECFDDSEYVRVGGKWVPQWLAKRWAGGIDKAKQVVRETLPSETATDNFGRTFQALAAIDYALDTVLGEIQDPDGQREQLFPGCPTSGFGLLMTLGYLMGGPPEIDPDFHVKTKESLQAKGKTVLVYCYAPKELKWDNEKIDYDVAKHLAHQLMQKKIAVVDSDRFCDWLDKHDKWKKTSELGRTFKVDYVIHVDLKDFSLFEPHSPNLYRGAAKVTVNVVKMDDEKRDGNVIYTNAVQSKFPSRSPVDPNQMSLAEFKKRYLSALSFEIGELFFSVEGGTE